MKTYFISGHRLISQEKFDELYVPEIDKALEEGSRFVVGDCGGVDFMAQKYLVSKGAGDKVTVYHMFESPRNLASTEIKTVGGFKSDLGRDSKMTEDSDSDIAFIKFGAWGSGTAQNILRRYERNI